MRVRLYKLSAPGWEKEFRSMLEAKEELSKHVCSQCQRTNLWRMLDTACGAEYSLERFGGGYNLLEPKGARWCHDAKHGIRRA